MDVAGQYRGLESTFIPIIVCLGPDEPKNYQHILKLLVDDFKSCCPGMQCPFLVSTLFVNAHNTPGIFNASLHAGENDSAPMTFPVRVDGTITEMEHSAILGYGQGDLPALGRMCCACMGSTFNLCHLCSLPGVMTSGSMRYFSLGIAK